MDVQIEFALDDYACLFAKIPAKSSLRRHFKAPELRSGAPASGEAVISCSPEEAESLLEIARQHCPGAIAAIQQALTRASRSDS